VVSPPPKSFLAILENLPAIAFEKPIQKEKIPNLSFSEDSGFFL
jgi:hypothetical protein